MSIFCSSFFLIYVFNALKTKHISEFWGKIRLTEQKTIKKPKYFIKFSDFRKYECFLYSFTPLEILVFKFHETTGLNYES